MSRTILLTGGGTGGHVYPAVAIAQALRQTDSDVRFVYAGVRGGIEEAIAQRYDMPFCRIVAAPYPGLRRPLRFLVFALTVGFGTLLALGHLLRHRPSAVVATGGYVAAPAVFAAVVARTLRLLRLRIFVHEQNMRPGRLNMLVARFADVVGVSFPGSEKYLAASPARYVGYPVRPGLRAALEAGPDGGVPEVLDDLPPGRKIVLAFGGSQGARTVNRAVVDALVHLHDREDVFVVHGVGRRQRGGYDPEADVAQRIRRLQGAGELPESLEHVYRRVPYIDDIGTVYQAASLVVCRGGAGTIKELCAVGRPGVVLPKAGLAGDHQVMNALVLEQAGAGVVLHEEPSVGVDGLLPAVPGDRLAAAVTGLLDDPDRLVSMASAAAALDDPDAMARILSALATTPAVEALAEVAEVPQESTAARPEIGLAEKAPGALLGHVRSWQLAHPAVPVRAIPGLAYLQYRAASMTTAGAWRIRNVGVKLIGLLHIEDQVPLLRWLFEDPVLAGRVARLCGGDRAQNGFIRRNILSALIQIGVVDEDVQAVVKAGVTDRYWEVRREACHAIRRLPTLHSLDWARETAERLLSDRTFEVRIAAIRAVGATLDPSDGLPLLQPFYMDANWKIRHAVLTAFDLWAEGADAALLERLRAEFDNVLLTAGGYRPVFGLKETAHHVSQLLARRDQLPSAEAGEERPS